MKFAICIILTSLLVSCAFSRERNEPLTMSWGNFDSGWIETFDVVVDASLFQIKNQTINFPEFSKFMVSFP